MANDGTIIKRKKSFANMHSDLMCFDSDWPIEWKPRSYRKCSNIVNLFDNNTAVDL